MINNPVLQLQVTPLPPEAATLLQKGPIVAIAHKTIPYMDIIQETERAAQSLERQGQRENGEKLRQDVSKILHTSANNPRRHTTNLNETEQKGLKLIQAKIKNKEIAVAPQDKGMGFVTLPPHHYCSFPKSGSQHTGSL